MHSKAKPPTKAEKKRFERIVELGCVACRVAAESVGDLPGLRVFAMPCEVHHLTDGGARRGHSFTVGLCPWHHRGVSPHVGYMDFDRHGSPSSTLRLITDRFGPSLYHDAREFHKRYGSDDELLAFQNTLLAAQALEHVSRHDLGGEG